MRYQILIASEFVKMHIIVRILLKSLYSKVMVSFSNGDCRPSDYIYMSQYNMQLPPGL